MAAARLAELVEPVEVGRYYQVPSIRIDDNYSGHSYRLLNCMSWVPVWPQLHDDADIGFPDQHYHVDWRFVSDEDIRCVTVTAYGSHFRNASIEVMLAQAILLVIVRESVKAGPVDRLQRCHRDQLTWPSHHRAPERLEPKYKNAKLKCGRCPHWGFDLNSVAPDANGIIQCPGHGLCFRADTGQVVVRKEVKPS